jgi:hypothetical protein
LTRSRTGIGDRASSAGIDTAHLGAYAGTSVGGFNLRAGAAYALHDIDTGRQLMFPGFFDRAAAHYEGGTGQLFGEVGYGPAFGHVAVEPFAGAAWVRARTDGFAETAGLSALSGFGTSQSVGYSSLGVRAATRYVLQNGIVLIPRATLAWQHAFDDVTPPPRWRSKTPASGSASPACRSRATSRWSRAGSTCASTPTPRSACSPAMSAATPSRAISPGTSDQQISDQRDSHRLASDHCVWRDHRNSLRRIFPTLLLGN